MKKTKRWKSASPEERMMWILGIGPRYWDTDIQALTPCAFTVDRKFEKTTTVSKKQQTDVINKIVEDPKLLKYPKVVGVGSDPTDDLGLSFAFGLAKIAIKEGMSVSVLDLGDIPSPNKSVKEMDRYDRLRSADLVIIHNIMAESTGERLQLARDWVKRSKDKFCVFIVAGADPLWFADNRLRLPVDACFKFEGTKRPKVREY